MMRQTITKGASTLANKEEKIKDKMLDALERAIEDPHLIDDKEWSRLFGAASLARAMSIVSKLKGRPADDAATIAENHEPLSKEESAMFAAWLEEGVRCPSCSALVVRDGEACAARVIEDQMPPA